MFNNIRQWLNSGSKGYTSAAPLNSFQAYQNAAIPISEIARRYSAHPEAVSLIRRFIACPEASTCAMQKAQFLAQYSPRLYMRGNTGASFDGVKRSRKALTKAERKYLRSSNPTKGVGTVSQYAVDAGDIYEVTAHPCLTLINNPNPYETKDVYWGMDNLQREIFGNSFALIVRGEDGLPSELRHMYGQHVRIRPSRTDWIDAFEYTVPPQQSEEFSPEEVAHFKYGASPLNMLYGSSWFARVVSEMDLLSQARAVEQYRFENGLRTDFAILTPDYNPAQKDEIRKEVQRRGVGVKNSGGFLILDGAESLVPLTRTNKEMEYSEGMQRAARTIRGAAGIPEAMANLNQANLASALQADGQYLQASIQPLLCSHAQQLTSFLNRNYNHEEGEYWFAYDNIIEPNEDDNIKTTIAMLGSDLLLVNEARERIGYNPLDDSRGTKLLSELRSVQGVSLPMLPSESEALTPVNAEPAAADLSPSLMGRPPEGGAVAEVAGSAAANVADTALNGAQLSEVKQTLIDAATGLLPLATAEQLLRLALPTTPPEQIAAMVASLRGFKSPEATATPPTTAAPTEAAKAKAAPSVVCLSGYCLCGTCRTKDADIEGEAFSRKHYEQLKANVDGWLRKSADSGQYHETELHKALEPLRPIFQEGGQDGIGVLLSVPGGAAAVDASGVSFDVLTPQTVQHLDTYTIRLAQSLSKSRQADLQEAVKRQIAEGQTPSEAYSTVKQSLQERTADDAERIARTESSRAYNQGNLKAWKDAGCKRKQMLLAPGSCPLCGEIAARHNKEVDIGHVFFPKGTDVTVGDTTYRNDYEDMDSTPIHPQCRCTMLPVVD